MVLRLSGSLWFENAMILLLYITVLCDKSRISSWTRLRGNPEESGEPSGWQILEKGESGVVVREGFLEEVPRE